MTTEASKPKAFVLHADEGEWIDAFGNKGLFKLTGANTGGSLTLMLSTVPAGGGTPPHIHNVDDEMFIIVEGRYRFVMNGVSKEVGPGAIVYLPRDCVHSFQNIGDTPSKHWALLTPSGFETFYARCAELFAQPGPPNFARIAAITREQGYQIFAQDG
jgi:quercetin dioxygenase-like cupin family protein